METKTESKEEEWKETKSLSSSSRSSSITSDESDGHFDIRHFPLPKPILSASEAQKQRETYQAYSSSVSSYTSSTWSSVHLDLPGYDPNRIPSSIFSSKPGNSVAGNSAEWSIASNESLFSIHDMNFSSTTTLKLSEIPRLEETVHEVTEVNPVNKPEEYEKETIIEEKPNHEVKPNSEIDDDEMIEEVIIELESDDEQEEYKIQTEILVEIKTEKQEEKEIVEDVKAATKQEDSTSIVHSPSLSCLSDTSNNSISSFAFPLLQKEDGTAKTPVMEISKKVSQKRRPEYLLPQSPKQPPQPQLQFYQESGSRNRLNPQRKVSNQFESQTKSPKSSRNSLLSCLHCKCGFN